MEEILGPNSTEILWWQMGLRGVIVFVVAIFLVRIGDQRVFGKNSAFDIVLGLILGSILSRAITGNAPFLESIFTSLVLVAMHWLLAYVSFNSDFFGKWVKGRETQVVKNGEMLHDNLNKTRITKNDLAEALRQNSIENLEDVENVYIERSGDLSIIPKKEK